MISASVGKFFVVLGANRRCLEQFVIVEGITHEQLAVVATLKCEFFVKIYQATQQTNLDASLTLEVVRRRKCALEHATDSAVHKVDVAVPESEIDMESEFCVEVSIELTAGIPARATSTGETRCSAKVCACCIACQFCHNNINAGFGTEFSVDEAQIEFNLAPNRGTQHYAATQINRHCIEFLLDVGLCFEGSAHVVALRRAVLSTVKEFCNILGERWQLTVVWQFRAEANISVGTDVNGDDFRLEVDKLKVATLIFIGVTYPNIPVGALQVASIFAESNLQRKFNVHLAKCATGLVAAFHTFQTSRPRGFVVISIAHNITHGIGTEFVDISLELIV